MEREKLYIGINIPESRAKDYFSGYGAKELMVTICSFIAAVILAILLYMNTKQILFSLLIGVGVIGLSVLIVKRNQFDESLIDQVQIIRKFKKAQKQYEYEYYDIYTNEGMNDGK